MSQNKTKVAGLDSYDLPNYGNPGTGGAPDPSFYARSGNGPKRGTVIAGLGGYENPRGAQGPQPVQNGPASSPNTRPMPTGKPVVGFLYSISKTAVGEYWPIHIGQNTIGQSPSCDIVLTEATVSSEHAVIVARKMKNPEKIIASLSDARSTNGTMINGESLGFTAVDCKNGDIITIGENYELVLVLIDTAAMGLRVSETFINTEDDSYADMPPQFDANATRAGYTPDQNNFNPPPFTPPTGGTGGTVGMDGNNFGGHGGTVGM